MKDNLPLREAYLIAFVLTSATVIVTANLVNKGDPNITIRYFDLLQFLVGGILGFAVQRSLVE